MNDLAGYDEIKARHMTAAPSAYASIALLHFDDMEPRLSDGYQIKNLLGSTAMTVVYGESGSGKTFYVLHLGLCVAAGDNCFGRRVRKAGVIYVAAEAGRGIENRIAAAKREISFPKEMPFAAITTPVDLCSNDADLRQLIAAIRSAEIGMTIELIIIDTLSRVMGGGNENSPEDMGALVRNIDLLRAETGAAVMLVHHSGKNPALGARGHSLLHAAIDTEIEVTRDNATGISTATVTKQRELPTAGAMSFALRPVELGVDQDGDVVTSCIVEQIESPVSPTPKVKPLSPAQSRALQLLADAIGTGGLVPPATTHIPTDKRCVTEEVWRKYCYRGAISDGDQDAKQKAFKRSAQVLLDAGRIGKWEPYVWLT